MKKYFNYPVKKVVTVRQLVTVELLEFSAGFSYPDEAHGFYEFAYVDKGEVECRTEGKSETLKQGDFYLIPPGAHHSYAVGNALPPPSVFILCFQCDADILEILHGKTKTDKEIRALLSDLVNESRKAFRFPFHRKLRLLDQPAFGALQLIEYRTEEILIKLVRARVDSRTDIHLLASSTELENRLSNDIVSFLKERLYGKTTLREICDRVYFSEAYIQRVFKKNTGYTIKHYAAVLKINEAKKLLREKESTQSVADKLQFDSAGYFCKVFKQHTGMTPAEFRKSVL